MTLEYPANPHANEADGIEAIYRRLSTSKPVPGYRSYPYLLRCPSVTQPNQSGPKQKLSEPPGPLQENVVTFSRLSGPEKQERRAKASCDQHPPSAGDDFTWVGGISRSS